MGKLTKRVAEGAEARDTEYTIWDKDIPGFGLRVMPSGRRSYMIQYRNGTRTRRMVLGPHGVLTPEQARTMAMSALAAVRQGGDPAADRQARRGAIIVKELAERFDNPRKHIRKYPEEKRERFLSAAELRRVGAVLSEMETENIEMPSAIAAVRLLMLTGCRLNEIMTLKWAHVDADAPALRLPDSKTGAKTVHLGKAALDVLLAIPQAPDNSWVITGTKEGARLSDLQPFWRRVRARAGIKDVRIHDLRHTFASTAVAGGQGLPMIGKLLGHTQGQTTARYAHLAADPVREAADQVSGGIAAALGFAKSL